MTSIGVLPILEVTVGYRSCSRTLIVVIPLDADEKRKAKMARKMSNQNREDGRILNMSESSSGFALIFVIIESVYPTSGDDSNPRNTTRPNSLGSGMPTPPTTQIIDPMRQAEHRPSQAQSRQRYKPTPLNIPTPPATRFRRSESGSTPNYAGEHHLPLPAQGSSGAHPPSIGHQGTDASGDFDVQMADSARGSPFSYVSEEMEVSGQTGQADVRGAPIPRERGPEVDSSPNPTSVRIS
jgi:hypothetical protein